jgi:hypothetical protein
VNSADAPEAPQVNETRQQETEFRDASTGVQFAYPSAWRPLQPGSQIGAPELSAQMGLPRITEVFEPAHTDLGNTNLTGLLFAYAVKGGTDAESCNALGAKMLGGSKAGQETVNGVTFSRMEGSDSGMCHQRSIVLDSAFRDGECYVFERDLDTACADVKGPGTGKALTQAQRQALQKQLDEVMNSVRLR